jgi:hypothetical protein
MPYILGVQDCEILTHDMQLFEADELKQRYGFLLTECETPEQVDDMGGLAIDLILERLRKHTLAIHQYSTRRTWVNDL